VIVRLRARSCAVGAGAAVAGTSLVTSHAPVETSAASPPVAPRHSISALARMRSRWPGAGPAKGNVQPVFAAVPGPPAWNQPESPPAATGCQPPSAVEKYSTLTWTHGASAGPR
jgi:hypothetical protein